MLFTPIGLAVMSGRGTQEGTAAAPSTDTWNPSDKAAGITLSNGNLTATWASGASANVRSARSHATGKYHFEITIGTFATFQEFGVAASGQSLSLDIGLTTNGASFDSDLKFYCNGEQGFFGGSPAFDFSSGAVYAFEIDLDGLTFKIQNFTTGSGYSASQSIAALTTPVFICAALYGGSATLNTGATAYSVAPTSGYGNW